MYSSNTSSIVIGTLLRYLHLENHKIVSLVSSTFREVFTRRRYLASMTLLVYSYDQLQEIREHERLLQNVQHLHILVTQKSVKFTAFMNQQEKLTRLEHFMVRVICEVAAVARLTSIGISHYTPLIMQNVSFDYEVHQALHQAQLMAIPAENLSALSYVNIVPLNSLSVLFETLISRASRIETLEFRERMLPWMTARENPFLTACCAPLATSHLVTVRQCCPRLTRLLGVHVDRTTVAVLETFAEKSIKLTDVYLVHENVAEEHFQRFLEKQPTLVNVHIENIRSSTPSTSLYEVACSTLVNLKKFDVFGVPPIVETLTGQQLERVVQRQVNTLNKVRIDSWINYDYFEPLDVQRLAFRCVEPRSWVLYMPWTVVHTLRSLSLCKVWLKDHMADLLRTVCPLLQHANFKNCYFDSYLSFVAVSRMQQLDKLTLYMCRCYDKWPSKAFSMPQLRRLDIQVDCTNQSNQFNQSNQSQQSNVLELIANAPNLVRLKVIDFGLGNSADVIDAVWLQLKQLRWITTNVYNRLNNGIRLDVSFFPLLERLCIVPRILDTSGDLATLEVVGTEKRAVFINSTYRGPLIISLY